VETASCPQVRSHLIASRLWQWACQCCQCCNKFSARQQSPLHRNKESLLPAGALSKLDVISAPAFGRMTVLEALKAGLRSAQEKIEGGQKTTFGAGSMGRPDKAMVVAGLCPIHGPVVRSATTELIYKYRCAPTFLAYFDLQERCEGTWGGRGGGGIHRPAVRAATTKLIYKYRILKF